MKRLVLILIAAACVAIPSGADEKWRIEVGPPGNEFSSAQEASETKQAPESVRRWAEIIAPDTEVRSATVYSSDLYQVAFENERERYWSLITASDQLVYMVYTDIKEDLTESANAIVPKGKKVAIEIEQLPAAMVETLAKLMPDSAPRKAWYADTLVGPRYIAQVGASVFYATPAGNIRCGGMAGRGALSEVAADATLGPILPESVRALLTPHRERFNLQNQIAQLKEGTGNAGHSFRFVVMGDSRSQQDLWEAIVAHIDGLDPRPAFVINSGDVVVQGGADEFAEYYIPPLLDTAIPHFVAIGNHDTGQGDRANEFKYLFGQDALNYYFDYGNCRFVFLDNVSRNLPWDKVLEIAGGWLADTPSGYRKVLTVHQPPANIQKWAYHAMGVAESKKFTELMAKHRVDEVFLGHIHAYSTATLDGVSYTVAGGGGAGLHDRFGPSGNVHHYVICDVTSEGITQQVVRFYAK